MTWDVDATKNLKYTYIQPYISHHILKHIIMQLLQPSIRNFTFVSLQHVSLY